MILLIILVVVTASFAVTVFLQNQKLKAQLNQLQNLLQAEIAISTELYTRLGQSLTLDMLGVGLELKPVQILVCTNDPESLSLRLHFDGHEVWSGVRWLSVNRSSLFYAKNGEEPTPWKHVPNFNDTLVTDKIDGEMVIIVKPGYVTRPEPPPLRLMQKSPQEAVLAA